MNNNGFLYFFRRGYFIKRNIYIPLLSSYNIMKNEQYFMELEKEKIKSVGDWDGIKYIEVCDKLGITPEILELSELGQADRKFNLNQRGLEKAIIGEKKRIRKRSVPNKRYKDFYDEGGKLISNIGASSDNKMGLLIKYFPGRFGDRGRQPVCEMNYLSADALFNKIMGYAESRINQ